MKICVVGAGAIGGLMGVKLAALSGHEVTLIARGPHLAAIKQDGLKLIMNDGTEAVAANVAATSDMRECGVQDLVILALKAHQLPPVIDEICTLIGDQTTVLTTQNGLPWWYFQRHGGPHDGKTLKSLDPQGELTRKIDPAKILGCIAYPAAEIAERERQEIETLKQLEELSPLQTEFIRIRYANARELFKLFDRDDDADEDDAGAGSTGSILSPRGRVVVDERTNALLITDTAEKIEEFRQAGMDNHIIKPIDQTKLKEMTDQYL